MPVAQNAHAIVNAGIMLQLNQQSVVQSARIVYGGITPEFIHATRTEKYLIGKNLFDNTTLQGAFNQLNVEIVPDYNENAAIASPAYRKGAAISIFYKV